MPKTDQSPFLTQYWRIKQQYSGDILFFRLGDFYEMFAGDAIEVSALLNLTLTSRNGLPMCGVPHHSARPYIARLLKHGKKVALCEQLTAPQKGKAIIERDVVEVITPGTTVDEDFLEKGDNNYLACVCARGSKLAFAYIELSTGEFEAKSFELKDAAFALRAEFERLQIKELIIQESLLEESGVLLRVVNGRSGMVINRWMDWLFDGEKSLERLKRQFGTESLKGFGFAGDAPEISAAGALLEYLSDTAKSLLPHIRKIRAQTADEFAGIDEASLKNLELVRNLSDGGVRFSLLEILDETKTAMGRRLLKRRLVRPLRDAEKIRARHDFVDGLYHNQGRLSALRDMLAKTPDIERQCSRLAMGRSHGKDLLALMNALSQFERITQLCGWKPEAYEAAEARALDGQGIRALAELRELLERALCDEPSTLLTEGKLIRAGYSADLDNLHRFQDNSRGVLEEYLEEERSATGIASLKIRHNRVMGYFFEVTNVNLTKIPPHFIKRQSVTGGARFSTERLAALESDINGALDKIIELEKNLFLALRDTAAAQIPVLAAAACALAELDVAQSCAAAATARGWVRPVVDTKNRLRIIEGRHPVVEANLPRGEFIPNDAELDAHGAPDGQSAGGVYSQAADSGASTNAGAEQGDGIGRSARADEIPAPASFALITGPNMAGKSTYLRQNALIVIMAQIGSFVPARSAQVGIADRIYCRVGASDNLARGESTFLTEMNETAYILNTATESSLVIMDEVGRGTGTLDGLSIAQAVCETLIERVRCRTFFATHYHELAEMENPRLIQQSMRVDEVDGRIVFRRKLIDGPAAESYGLHVARIAGVDEAVLKRAEQIMLHLKRSRNAPAALPPEPARPVKKKTGKERSIKEENNTEYGAPSLFAE
ncbi:MAG: DNA mismatch repair protein MutS [Spirochaetaceae bacterium]|nr:DNA mismatch repair protein MutS [Spirochaetaceae bacterium]